MLLKTATDVIRGIKKPAFLIIYAVFYRGKEFEVKM
jgi:hypothetical protein